MSAMSRGRKIHVYTDMYENTPCVDRVDGTRAYEMVVWKQVNKALAIDPRTMEVTVDWSRVSLPNELTSRIVVHMPKAVWGWLLEEA